MTAIDGPTARVLRTLIPSVYAPTFLEFTGLAALLPLVPLIALDLGFNVPQSAGLTVIFGAASFLGPIPAGRLIARLGARPALVGTGVLLVGAGLALFALLNAALDAPSGPMERALFVALLVVIAAATQVWQLGRQSYLGTALPPTMRARGMTLFGGVLRLGEVVGPLLGAAVMASWSIPAVFLLFAVVVGAGTALIALFLPPGERTVRTAGPGRKLPRSPARRRLDRAVLARMVSVGAGIAPVMMARVNRPVIVPLLGAALGLDALWISIVFGVGAAVEILLVVPAGTLMDRYGRAAAAVPCALGLGAGFVLLAVLGTLLAGRGEAAAVVALVVPMLLIAVSNGLGSGIVMTLGIDVSPVHGRTGYLAWWNTMLGGGRLVAPLLVSGITLLAPVAAAGAVTGALCLAGGAWLARTLPRVTPSGGVRGRT